MVSFKRSGLARPSDDGAGYDLAALLQRSQLAVLLTLIFLTIGAWGLTIIQAQSKAGRMDVVVDPAGTDDPMNAMGDMTTMDGMEAMPAPGSPPDDAAMTNMAGMGWSLGGLAAFVGAWAVMMAAMMLPAVAPLLLLYRTIAAKSMPGDRAFFSTWILVGGYLLVWTAVGVGAYVLS